MLKSDDTRRTRTWNLWLRGPTPYRPARDPVRLSCATLHLASTSPIYTEAFFAQGIHCIDVSTPCGTRTRNLRIRSPTPCPLGQGGCAGLASSENSANICPGCSAWLWTWARNPLGSARRGSNPLGVITEHHSWCGLRVDRHPGLCWVVVCVLGGCLGLLGFQHYVSEASTPKLIVLFGGFACYKQIGACDGKCRQRTGSQGLKVGATTT